MLINIEYRRSIQNAKAIPGKSQHLLVVADINKKKIRNVVRKTCTEKKVKFAERCGDQELILRKTIQIS